MSVAPCLLTHSEKHAIICVLTDLYCDTFFDDFNTKEDHEKCAEWDRTYDYFCGFSDYELFKQYQKVK